MATLEFSGSRRALLAQRDRMSAGGTLEELWKSGRQGNLCPLEQVRAIALRAIALRDSRNKAPSAYRGTPQSKADPSPPKQCRRPLSPKAMLSVRVARGAPQKNRAAAAPSPPKQC